MSFNLNLKCLILAFYFNLRVEINYFHMIRPVLLKHILGGVHGSESTRDLT